MRVEDVELYKIDPNPMQPRRSFDIYQMKVLINSIKENGMIQPIIIERINGADPSYYLRDGERRFRAVCALSLINNGIPEDEACELVSKPEFTAIGLVTPNENLISGCTIVAVITDSVSDKDQLIQAVLANKIREDLNPIDLAGAIGQLKKMGLSDEKIGRRLQMSRPQVTNHRRLLTLPDNIQEKIKAGILSPRRGVALASYYSLSEGAQEALARLPSVKSPETYSSDMIRNQIISAFTDLSSAIMFPIDQVIKHPRAIHETCCSCEYLEKSGPEYRCFNLMCLNGKNISIKTMEIADFENIIWREHIPTDISEQRKIHEKLNNEDYKSALIEGISRQTKRPFGKDTLIQAIVNIQDKLNKKFEGVVTNISCPLCGGVTKWFEIEEGVTCSSCEQDFNYMPYMPTQPEALVQHDCPACGSSRCVSIYGHINCLDCGEKQPKKKKNSASASSSSCIPKTHKASDVLNGNGIGAAMAEQLGRVNSQEGDGDDVYTQGEKPLQKDCPNCGLREIFSKRYPDRTEYQCQNCSRSWNGIMTASIWNLRVELPEKFKSLLENVPDHQLQQLDNWLSYLQLVIQQGEEDQILGTLQVPDNSLVNIKGGY